MNVLLSDNNYLDCTYSDNHAPIYGTSTVRLTPSRLVTNVTKSALDAALPDQAIAQIHWNSFWPNKLVLHGKKLNASWNGVASLSWAMGFDPAYIFHVTNFDGQVYKWGSSPDKTLTLISKSSPSEVLARFTMSHTNRAEVLRIAPAGVDVADFILVTFIYFKSTIEKSHASSGAVDGGDAGANDSSLGNAFWFGGGRYSDSGGGYDNSGSGYGDSGGGGGGYSDSGGRGGGYSDSGGGGGGY